MCDLGHQKGLWGLRERRKEQKEPFENVEKSKKLKGNVEVDGGRGLGGILGG